MTTIDNSNIPPRDLVNTTDIIITTIIGYLTIGLVVFWILIIAIAIIVPAPSSEEAQKNQTGNIYNEIVEE